MTRFIASIATAGVAAAFLCTGCGTDETTGKTYGGATTGAGTTVKSTVTTAGTAKPTAAPTASAKAGTGVLKGVAKLTGAAPEMKVPKARAAADVCKDKAVVYNAVVAKDGKLKDVYVAIADDVAGDFKAATAATVHQSECMYEPRMQGILAGQVVEIANNDAAVHNINVKTGDKLLFNQAQPKGAPVIKSEKFEEPGTYRMQCDVHPWMRAFVIASAHPYFAVTAADGSFKIEKVPDGKFTIRAWHSTFGEILKKDIEVKGGEVTVDFEYTGKEPEPKENVAELKDLW
ncbi:MAG: hypothetical protein EXR75_16350 [Myxococcales bacterium]|nr:hypothetical protein [Myxococcales bacterium]